MNLSFEAKMAKTKGDEKSYLEQMRKAFFLENIPKSQFITVHFLKTPPLAAKTRGLG